MPADDGFKISCFVPDHDCYVSAFGAKDPRKSFTGTCLRSSPKRGTLIFKNGDKYIGELADGKLDGYGLLTYSPKDRHQRVQYQGDFKAGKRSGQGTFRWKNGAVYTGSYVDGERVGFGTFIFGSNDPAERKSYVGQWEKNAMSGEGTLVYQVKLHRRWRHWPQKNVLRLLEK